MTTATTTLEASVPETTPPKRSPLTWVPTLYTAESLPFNAAIIVSVMMYKSLGLSDGAIAFWTGWLLLPWTLKPFFAPFLELVRNVRGAVLLTQLFGGAGFAVMALMMPLPFAVQATLALFFLLAFNSATHDTAADGLYIAALSTEEQSKYVGMQSAFWNLGQVVAQGGLLVLAGTLENVYGIIPAWMIVWGAFGALMAGFAGWHWLVLPKAAAAPEGSVAPTLKDIPGSFREISAFFFLKRNVWWLILFALVYRSAEGQAEKIVQLFMRAAIAKGGLGLSLTGVGVVYGFFGTLGMIGGSMLGGWFASKVSLKRAVVPLAVIFNVPNALFIYLAYAQPTPFEADWAYWGPLPVLSVTNWPSFLTVAACASIEKASLGMGFVAMTLVLMQQLAPGRFSTAHYGYATALMGVGMMVPSMTSGFVSDALGYRGFFVYLLLMGVPSMAVASIVPIRDDVGDPDVPDGAAGAAVLSGAWGTAIGAGSLYLLTAFSGLVFGGIAATWVLVTFGLLTALGVFLGVRAIGVGRAAAKQAAALAQPISTQATLAGVLGAVAIVAWLAGFGWIGYGAVQLGAARTLCATTNTADACEPVCVADSDSRACKLVMDAKAKTLAGKPTDADAAHAAFDAAIRSLDIDCFEGAKAQACLDAAAIYENPSAFAAAQLTSEKEEAKRFVEEGKRHRTKAGQLGAK